jgi:hypothetical protein
LINLVVLELMPLSLAAMHVRVHPDVRPLMISFWQPDEKITAAPGSRTVQRSTT